MRELRGRVAVVTGAASGIGRGIATKLASEGMSLALADIEEPALATAVDELAASGARVIGVPTDVSDADSMAALSERVLAELGSAHLICNCAGVYTGGLADELSLDAWRWLLGVNLWGAIHSCSTFL